MTVQTFRGDCYVYTRELYNSLVYTYAESVHAATGSRYGTGELGKPKSFRNISPGHSKDCC